VSFFPFFSFHPLIFDTTRKEPHANQSDFFQRLSSIDGDWHEFESKALRKENERRDREAARKAAREKDKKRPIDGGDQARDAKRQAVEGKKPAAAIGDAA
jgi:CTD kinase subunit alpha